MSQESTIFCKNGGCTAKLGPDILSHVLKQIPQGNPDKDLLVGYHHSDDAAVYRLTEDLAMVQTLDFFPPMIDDPYLFGQIAATNALSDIYAMGAQVKTALNIVCFPEQMDLNILGKILLGGSEKVAEAGGVLAGGHSIHDEGVKYGLSVTGVIHPNQILANRQSQIADKLILTKPLGIGIICAANRMGAASTASMDMAVTSMTTLNRYASEILKKYRVHSCTDITGFGLLKHLDEMLDESHSAIILSESVPVISEALDYAENFFLTAAGQRNRNALANKVQFACQNFAMEELLFDPQTSGGLLVCINPEDAPAALRELNTLSLQSNMIGEVVKRSDYRIKVI